MNRDEGSSATNYFDADHPIERREQDLLGRRSFAEAIARHIRSVPADHGFTIAVVGEWGSGKTSVLNMVAEILEGEVDTPAVLWFNPWLFRGAAELVTRFFNELSAQLGQDKFEGLKRVVRALAELSQTLAPLSPVPGTTEVVKAAAKQAVNATEPPSLHQRRDGLKEALAESKSRIIVLIDDIDRLEPSEIRELVRLVRLTSSLPNLVFLLAFDRRYIAKSLDENETEGQQYLDKIVQMTYNIPAVRKEALTDLLLTWLEDLIQRYDVTQLDPAVWGRVFYDVIEPVAGTLRDVKRYINSLPVTLATIGREVALADLLGLEALRVLRPSLLEELKARADCLVHSDTDSRPMMTEQERKDEIHQELSTMLESAGPERPVLESVLEILFPATTVFLGSTSYYGSHWNATWRRDRRVACEDVLRIYLQAGLDETALSVSEVQDLIRALTNERELARLIDALECQRFERALEQLAVFDEDFPVGAIPIAVPVLANRLHRMSRHSAGLLTIAPYFKLTRVIYRILRRLPDQERLANIMPEMLERVDTLSGRLFLVEMVGHSQSDRPSLIGEDQSKLLKNQLAEQMTAASAKQLAREWDLYALCLRIPLFVDGPNKPQLTARFREHLTEDEFVLALWRSSVDYSHYNNTVQKQLPWSDLVEAFGEGLAGAAHRLACSKLRKGLTKEDQNTIDLAAKYASGLLPDEPVGR